MISIKTLATELNSIMDMEQIDVNNIDDVSKSYLSTIVASIVNLNNKAKPRTSKKKLMNLVYRLTEEAQALRDHWTLDSLASFAKLDFQNLVSES